MLYLQASLKLHPGKQQDFVKLLNDVMPSLNKHGWKLVGSFAATTGRLNTAVDFWEIPDAESVGAVLNDAEFLKSASRIAEIVEDEVLTLLTKLPIG
jgi:NIPSNAP